MALEIFMHSLWHTQLTQTDTFGSYSTSIQEDIRQLAAQQPCLSLLDHLSSLEIQGPDASKFLQGQLTCDVQDLNPGSQTLAAHCDHKGRVQSLFHLYKVSEQHFIAIMPKAILESGYELLKKYSVFSKVELHKTQWSVLALHHQTPKVELPLYALPFTQAASYLVTGPDEALEAYRSSLSLPNLGSCAWHWLSIQHGLPALDAESQGQYTPHMLNLPQLGAVSFTKGCYTGQEIVARTQYLGKLKRQLYHLQAASNVAAHSPLVQIGSEQVCGQVLQVQPNPSSGYDMLAVVTIEAAARQELVPSSQPELTLSVVSLPYDTGKA